MSNAALAYGLNIYRPVDPGVPLHLDPIETNNVCLQIINRAENRRLAEPREPICEFTGNSVSTAQRHVATRRLYLPNFRETGSASALWDGHLAADVWNFLPHVRELDIQPIPAPTGAPTPEPQPCFLCGHLGQWIKHRIRGWLKRDATVHEYSFLLCGVCVDKARALPVRPRPAKPAAAAPAAATNRKRKAPAGNGGKRRRVAPSAANVAK